MVRNKTVWDLIQVSRTIGEHSTHLAIRMIILNVHKRNTLPELYKVLTILLSVRNMSK